MVDLDDAITEREGKTPAQLIVEDGEAAFRVDRVGQFCANCWRRTLHAVIALGGGAWIEETNRELINQYSCLSVWLDAPFEVCWARIETSGEDRPLGKTREQAQALYERRRPVYQLAAIHVQVTGQEDLEALISRIEKNLRSIDASA